VAENIHTHHILDVSLVPARIPDELRAAAEQLGVAIATKLGVVGLLAIEMFVTTGGEVLVNELAPRPHNSGHWSIDGCETSQFEQHVRAVCGLPLGGVAVREPTVMINILGDVWSRAAAQGREVNWPAILAAPRAKLHLYGKAEPRDGRKMGHFTVRAATVADAFAAALELKTKL
jgi:5-(carboxyamino)imidazole ribonucleotide synthase